MVVIVDFKGLVWSMGITSLRLYMYVLRFQFFNQ